MLAIVKYSNIRRSKQGLYYSIKIKFKHFETIHYLSVAINQWLHLELVVVHQFVRAYFSNFDHFSNTKKCYNKVILF